MSDLLIITPTRGRPRNARALLDAWGPTATEGPRLLLAVDDDDPELAGYRELELPACAELVVGPRGRLGPTLNRLAVERAPRHFAIGFMGDDHRPRTEGWDIALLAALREMGSGLAYGNDLIQGPNLPTAVVMTSDIVRALGYFSPPSLTHMYVDNAWLALGEALGRIRYLSDVVIEHLHPAGGTAPWDERYAEVNSREQYGADETAFRKWLAEDFEGAVARVNKAIGAPCA